MLCFSLNLNAISMDDPPVLEMRPSTDESIAAAPNKGGAWAASDMAADSPAEMPTVSSWAPFRTPIFRAFWLASLVSNVGTWVHEIGAGWLMTELDASPQMVAAVRTTMSLPVVLFALPSGVLADRFDRRRLMLINQWMMLAAAATLAAFTFTGQMTPWLLLALTLVMGFGLVIHAPTWQASIPELVPRLLLPQAIALGSISFNLARAAGPAVGGLLIGSLGIWSAFAVNACSFAAVIVVLLFWRRERTESSEGRSFGQSLGDGVRFVLETADMRHVLVRVALFVFPASAMWSLLPLIARQQLVWDAPGYGLLVCGLGAGAVMAAVVLQRLRNLSSSDRLVAGAMTAFAIALFIVSFSTSRLLTVGLMLPLGAAWMLALTTLNATAQLTLPHRMRARGMACYLMSLGAAMGLGAFVWGFVAEQTSPGIALAAAAASLPLLALLGLRFSVGTSLVDH